MKYLGLIHGSAQQALPVVIGKDTVYIHENIKKVSDNEYEYDEIQMTLDEYEIYKMQLLIEARIYTSLPTSVQAAMIDEEFATAEVEMEEILK